jgi:hypothetical protein
MPRLNGAEAASILKKAMPNTPVILFAMYTDLHADSICPAIGDDHNASLLAQKTTSHEFESQLQ